MKVERIDRSVRTEERAKPALPDGSTASGALARCIEPVEARRFLDEYWETKPLLVPRDEEGRFLDLLSMAEVERRVADGGLRWPAFRVVKEGEKIVLADYAEDIPWSPKPFTGTARVERIVAEFEGGATIVLQALQLQHPPLAEFCRDLEAELGHPVQANAYYTPASAQGFAVHHDTHDVFCLQVEGEKRWLVYPPVLELPLKDQTYVPEMGDPGDPVLDVTMHAGDLLYLPRGWLHQAMTSDAASLHLTIGVNVFTWRDAVREALDEAAREEVELRRGVPTDGQGPDGLLEALASRLAPEVVSSRRRRSFVKTRRPVRDDAFDQLRALDELDLDTSLERRRTVIADLSEAEDGQRLSFEGRELLLPAYLRHDLEFLLATDESFRPRDLPGRLDDQGRLVLVRRLVREGLLRIRPD
ncbi:MAG TPA: cupin domain-containing protein [Gaiellaceae bacterium]|nr:cupin domain-containing protein [Gaiellaceae bacterium]